MTNQCDHKWIDMEDGTLDRFCVKCNKKAKQNVMSNPITFDAAVSATQSVKRDTMTVPSPGGMIEVDKEHWLNEFYKQAGLRVGIDAGR